MRVEAWLLEHGMEADAAKDFRLIGEAVLLGSEDDVRALIQQVEETFPDRKLALVVLDTQARCTAGLEENSAKEMGLAVEAADEIKRSTGATVLLIHHSGYEGDHARGSTAVHAALDAQSVLGGTKAALTLTCTKQKDSDEFEPIRLALADAAASPARLQIARERLTEKQEQALEALRGYPSGLRARKWQKESGLIHSTFYNARKELVERGLVDRKGECYLVVDVKSSQSNQSSPASVVSPKSVLLCSPSSGSGARKQSRRTVWGFGCVRQCIA